MRWWERGEAREGAYLEAAGEHFLRGGHLFWDGLFVRGVLVGASLVCGGEKLLVSELKVDEVIEGLRDGVCRRGVLLVRVRARFRGSRLLNAAALRILENVPSSSTSGTNFEETSANAEFA